MSSHNGQSPTAQRDIYLAGEGDVYFQRHRTLMEDETAWRKRMVDTLAPLLNESPRALEIGASNGINLELLRRRHLDGEYYGVDPSNEAVAAGGRLYPHLNMQSGTADHVPLRDGGFNLVWFCFCLYLIDRPLLFKVIAEADRLLADGGILAIADFDPQIPRSRVYRHNNKLLSYKMNYANLFLVNPAYVLVEKYSFSAAFETFDIDPGNRCGFWVMHKNVTNTYLTEVDK